MYLNTGSLGPTPANVRERVFEAWAELETNPVRMAYGEGRAHVAANQVRESAATFLRCDPARLLITRSTTDAMNKVALSLRLEAGDRVLTTDQEHHGGEFCWNFLARRRGIAVDRVVLGPGDRDPGAIVEKFRAAMTPRTRVLSVSHILTSTGWRMPVREICALARSRGALGIIDGAQAIGQIALDIAQTGCHVYAGSGHKWLMGPKGTGFLYVSPDVGDALELVDWEAGPRYLTDATGVGSLPLVSGLGAAIENARSRGMGVIEARVGALARLVAARVSGIPGVILRSAPSGPLASALVAIELPSSLKAAEIHATLRDKHGVVLKLVEARWFNGLRFAPHIFNTEAEIDRAVAALGAEMARA